MISSTVRRVDPDGERFTVAFTLSGRLFTGIANGDETRHWQEFLDGHDGRLQPGMTVHFESRNLRRQGNSSYLIEELCLENEPVKGA